MEYGRYSAPNSQNALANIPMYNYHSNGYNIYNPNEHKYDTNTVPSFENNYDIYGFNTPQEILPYSQKTAEVSPNNYFKILIHIIILIILIMNIIAPLLMSTIFLLQIT